MPDLDRIERALRAADAAGNVEDARRLAAAYREARDAQQPVQDASVPVSESGQLPDMNVTAIGQMATQPRAYSPARPAPDALGQLIASDAAAMPWYEKSLIGVGRGMSSSLDAVHQLGAHVGDALGMHSPDDTRALDQRIADEAGLYSKGVGDTWQGKAGDLLGSALITAPIGGVVGAPAKSLAGALGKGLLAGAITTPLAEPVTDPNADFALSKLGQAAVGGATGGVVNGGLYGAGRFVRELLSRNMKFRSAAGGKIAEAAQEGAPPSPHRAFIDESDQLAAQTGVPLTPAQSTGSKGLAAMEQRLRQSPKTADAVFDHDQAATQALDDYVSTMLKNTASNARSPEETGDLVRKAINQKVGDVEAMRRKVAEQQYGAIRQLVGGKPLIQADNLRAALSDVVAEYGSIATPGARALNRFADKTGGSELGDVENLMKLRSYLSKVAGGQARISGEPVDRKIAAGMLEAIDNDLDASATQLGGRVGDMLRSANQNYRNFSQQMEYLKRSPLGKLLGEDITNTMTGGSYNTVPAEKILAKVKTMTPSEVSATRAMMQDVSPEAWQAVKRRLIEDALEQARSAAPSQGANTLAMQPTAFVRAINGHTAQGQDWAKALLDPGEMLQLNAAFKVAQRLGDKTGYNFSGTAPALEQNMADLATATKSNSLKAMAIGGAKDAYNFLSNRKLAAAMVSPDGRKALLQLEKLPPGSAKAREVARFLATIDAGDAVSDTQTADYQDRLAGAQKEWDAAMRPLREATPADQNVPDEAIQAELAKVAQKYNVSPDAVMGRQ